MTSWVDVYKSIRDKLIEKLVNLKIDNVPVFEAVYLGRKIAPTAFPCCFVFPMRVRATPASVASSQYLMPFEIRVVSKVAGAVEGFNDALLRLGEVEKTLITDRQHGGTSDNLEVSDHQPEVERPRVRERHESSFIVTFYRVI